MIGPDHPAVKPACVEGAKVLGRTVARTGSINMPAVATACINTALPHLTADDLRSTPAGQALMAETWSKFQEHYATEWEEAYPEDVFPSPAPAPAVVSRESVAASMMRQWAKNLRSDHNPFEEDDA